MTPWDALVALMDRLRDPGGCPWDREQSMADLKTYLLEEAYEVVDAIDSGQPEALREELGDLVFQVVFLARIAKEKGQFTLDDVLRAIAEKMVRRHPHVFGESRARTSNEVLRQWEEIKRAERHTEKEPCALDGVPRSLPALLRAQRLTTKASRVGFDWPGPGEVLEKVEEELAEARSAVARGSAEEAEEEVGDLLFAVVNLARHLGLDPESTLQKTNSKFIRRFQRVEELMREGHLDPAKTPLSQMDLLWERAKREEKKLSAEQGARKPTSPGAR